MVRMKAQLRERDTWDKAHRTCSLPCSTLYTEASSPTSKVYRTLSPSALSDTASTECMSNAFFLFFLDALFSGAQRTVTTDFC